MHEGVAVAESAEGAVRVIAELEVIPLAVGERPLRVDVEVEAEFEMLVRHLVDERGKVGVADLPAEKDAQGKMRLVHCQSIIFFVHRRIDAGGALRNAHLRSAEQEGLLLVDVLRLQFRRACLIGEVLAADGAAVMRDRVALEHLVRRKRSDGFGSMRRGDDGILLGNLGGAGGVGEQLAAALAFPILDVAVPFTAGGDGGHLFQRMGMLRRFGGAGGRPGGNAVRTAGGIRPRTRSAAGKRRREQRRCKQQRQRSLETFFHHFFPPKSFPAGKISPAERFCFLFSRRNYSAGFSATNSMFVMVAPPALTPLTPPSKKIVI